jgi:hypothetical protein
LTQHLLQIKDRGSLDIKITSRDAIALQVIPLAGAIKLQNHTVVTNNFGISSYKTTLVNDKVAFTFDSHSERTLW